MTSQSRQLTVLQGKFAAYLSWSQPFLYELLRGLEPHCRNVIVCNRTENLDRFPIDNIVRLKTRYLVRPSGALLAASHLFRHWEPDVLHAHFGWSGIRMLLLKQFLRLPMVTTFGGKDAGTQMHMPHYDQLYDILLSATDQIVCVSEDLKRQLVEHGVDSDRVEVIRRGTNLKQFRFIDRSQRDSNRPLQLLMVGRLVEKKGHRYAFEALSRLVKKGCNVTLTVAGEGNDYHKIRRLRNELDLRRHVVFAGTTNHEGVRQLMEAADVFLHCSVTGKNGDCEGIPNVIVEAAATGLPVIGTRHGGIVETIRHGETGLLVDEADAGALAEAIERLLDDRSARLEFGTAGSRFMHEEFDLQRQVERYLAIYEKLASAKQAGALTTPRHFIPEDFPEIITRTLQPKMGVQDFSLAELGEWVRGPGKMTNCTPTRKPSLLEQCYNLKEYVPQQIKFPVKAVLGKSLAYTIERLNALVYRRSIERLQSTDEAILEFFLNGGNIDHLPTEWERMWNAEQLFAQLPQLSDSNNGDWTNESAQLHTPNDASNKSSTRDSLKSTRLTGRPH